ncbi:3-hydroxyacyl-CoA dehydrogenase family protein [Streptomyces lonarensis]|uniref:3-hydroxyacyl-CoA dehydrogenase family protein n=1 Tax=Streptomyces lonarensis TaxID=700599 RepID=A0A7X6CXI2_9ACTN|nr:3-hydroxyacyl-CoA dehydrogenase family protein [Streptomyces lonarensis]NJQ04223.1 3-hydroxyacyl-CoA dehydrogenase family protein [Streptomyces lonarensis]
MTQGPPLSPDSDRTAGTTTGGLPPLPTAPPLLAAVIGGGRMGAGIAQAFATAGSRVVVVESDGGRAAAAVQSIGESLHRAHARGHLTEAPAGVADRVSAAVSLDGLPAETELVVEAVPEDAALKARLLAAAEQAVGPAAVLASNTSSLSLTELATVLQRPERFLGMHFFNPVPASALVELVTTGATDPQVVRAALAWTAALGKEDVVVRDSPGFASSRLGVALGLEAIRMVEEGVADPEAIDRAMTLGYRHPMGPLRLTDLVGLDVRLAIADHLHATLGERFAPPRLLREKVARGELGRKSGQGFHRWE